MDFENIKTILEILKNHPELVTNHWDEGLTGAINGTYFSISICCEGHGVVLQLADGSDIDFNLDEQKKQVFDDLFAEVRKASGEHSFTYLYSSLLDYDYYSNNTDNNQFDEAYSRTW